MAGCRAAKKHAHAGIRLENFIGPACPAREQGLGEGGEASTWVWGQEEQEGLQEQVKAPAGGGVQQAQCRVICEEDRARGRGSEALRRPRGSPQPGPGSSPTPASHLGHARGESAFEGIFLMQRPHQAGAAVGEGHEAELAVVAAHAAVPCGDRTGGSGPAPRPRPSRGGQFMGAPSCPHREQH